MDGVHIISHLVGSVHHQLLKVPNSVWKTWTGIYFYTSTPMFINFIYLFFIYYFDKKAKIVQIGFIKLYYMVYVMGSTVQFYSRMH